jgi:hypothetical protein
MGGGQWYSRLGECLGERVGECSRLGRCLWEGGGGFPSASVLGCLYAPYRVEIKPYVNFCGLSNALGLSPNAPPSLHLP